MVVLSARCRLLVTSSPPCLSLPVPSWPCQGGVLPVSPWAGFPASPLFLAYSACSACFTRSASSSCEKKGHLASLGPPPTAVTRHGRPCPHVEQRRRPRVTCAGWTVTNAGPGALRCLTFRQRLPEIKTCKGLWILTVSFKQVCKTHVQIGRFILFLCNLHILAGSQKKPYVKCQIMISHQSLLTRSFFGGCAVAQILKFSFCGCKTEHRLRVTCTTAFKLGYVGFLSQCMTFDVGGDVMAVYSMGFYLAGVPQTDFFKEVSYLFLRSMGSVRCFMLYGWICGLQRRCSNSFLGLSSVLIFW